MAVFTHLETDTGSDANISSATAVGAYTANADKLVMCDISIDAVAGNGDYVMYVTRQIGGAGSSYVILPKTTMAAASGLTAISGQSGWITVRNGDVLTVYVDGLAGDTSTPDWTTRWFELAGVTAAGVADAVWDEATADHTTSTTFGALDANVDSILADTGTDGVIVASGTVTTLTNLPAVTANWLTADGVKADAVTKIQNGLATPTNITAGTIATVTNAVKVSAGTGAGQLDFTSGVVKVNLVQILGQAISGTASLIVAAFSKFFNIASPTGTVNSLPDAVPGTSSGVALQDTLTNLGTRLTAARAGYLDKLNVTGALAHSDAAATYKADVSALALATDLQDVEDKIDVIATDTTTEIPATLTTIDNLVDDLESRLTAARAGYLDNLNTGVALTAAGVDAILDEAVVGSYTMRQLLKVLAAKVAGKATGGGTTSITYRGVDDASNVIVETVDANGNRSAVTLTV